MIHSLRGKVALITGGSSGIGLAIAKNFAAQGASTILVARDPERLAAAVTAVESLYTPPSGSPDAELPFYTAVAGDVAQPATWLDLCMKLRLGLLGLRRPLPIPSSTRFVPDTLHVLVNCAGIAQNASLPRVETDEIAAILDTNLRSAVLGSKYMWRFLANREANSPIGDKSIINVSSAMALGGGRGASVYAASKAGLLGLTSALAIEYGNQGRVRVNVLLPGYIETAMTSSLDRQRVCSRIPLDRLGIAEEVADAASFLARNAYANNCVLTLDGGLSANNS